MTDDWSVATFEGAERARARRAAGTDPQQRWDWLHTALLLAQRSGALARARERRQREVDEEWR